MSIQPLLCSNKEACKQVYSNLCEDRRDDCGQTGRFTQLILSLQKREEEEEEDETKIGEKKIIKTCIFGFYVA